MPTTNGISIVVTKCLKATLFLLCYGSPQFPGWRQLYRRNIQIRIIGLRVPLGVRYTIDIQTYRPIGIGRYTPQYISRPESKSVENSTRISTPGQSSSLPRTSRHIAMAPLNVSLTPLSPSPTTTVRFVFLFEPSDNCPNRHARLPLFTTDRERNNDR